MHFDDFGNSYYTDDSEEGTFCNRVYPYDHSKAASDPGNKNNIRCRTTGLFPPNTAAGRKERGLPANAAWESAAGSAADAARKRAEEEAKKKAAGGGGPGGGGGGSTKQPWDTNDAAPSKAANIGVIAAIAGAGALLYFKMRGR